MSTNTKVVVVTGGSAGVGRAAVREFASQGFDVAILARGNDGLEGAKKDVEKAGQKALTFSVDVADAAQIEEAAEKVENELGPIDVWVNNAMNSVFAPFEDIILDDYKRVTEVTYLGQVYGTKAALKRMIPRNKGSIVLVGSALAYRGIPLQSAYCGAKHAIQGFFDSVRSELIHDKSAVNISMVHLPALNTTQFGWVKTKFDRKTKPMGTIFQPEVAARSIYYAATHNRRQIYVGFPTVASILGNKLAPGLLDRHLAKNGYEGQLRKEKQDPGRKDNLYAPVPGDHGAHGEFDDQAKSSSPQFWATTHLAWVYSGIAALIIIAIALIF
ncbi:MAG: SDR family oxidoreductase [Candidatus Cyclobacteriaceae bacterium M3_2C_046]